ncbi:MAG: Omp28-related outer membrane protein [Bacteroidia bacterium]
MKKNRKYFSISIFAVILFLAACKEEPPYINYEPSKVSSIKTYILPTPPAAEAKQVLIEDVSGVQCPNCPTAATIAYGLETANQGRVNTVTVFPESVGNLTIPIKNQNNVSSKYDFRTKVGTDIVSSVENTSTLPIGYIDRNKFSGDWIVYKEDWNTTVTSELAVTTPVNIDITPSYNSLTNSINVLVKVTYTTAQTDSNFIHVMLVQDSVIDAQEKNTAPVYDSLYVHNNCLMDMITSHGGDLLNSADSFSLVKGRVFEITYNYVLDPRSNSVAGPKPPMVPWDTKHLRVLAFVARGSVTKYVLQSKSAPVQ